MEPTPDTIVIGIILALLFILLCAFLCRPSAEEQKKEQEQIAATREIAFARLIDHLEKKIQFVNQQSTWDHKFTKNQVKIILIAF